VGCQLYPRCSLGISLLPRGHVVLMGFTTRTFLRCPVFPIMRMNNHIIQYLIHVKALEFGHAMNAEALLELIIYEE
jgi:hypothetical protein